MRKILFGLFIGLISMGVSVGSGTAQTGTPPDIDVRLVMDGSAYVLGSDIGMGITLENVGEDDVVVSEGFSEEEFHLFFHFTGPDGETIIADARTVGEDEGGNPPPPPLIFRDNELLQAEPVDILAGTLNAPNPPAFIKTKTITDADSYYALTKAGCYSVKAIIPIRTYTGISQSIGDEDFAELTSFLYQGDLESNTVKFCLISDADGDGYSYPITKSPPAADPTYLADCDDRPDGEDGIAGTPDDGANINPGTTEIPDNGIDDDCNPATLDITVGAGASPGVIIVEAAKHTVGPGSHPGSSKEPLVGVAVKAFDMTGTCVSTYGVSWQNYKDIWENCTPEASGFTDGVGSVSLVVLPGEYLVFGNDSGIYFGGSVGLVESDQTKVKKIKLMVKANGKTVPAKHTKRTGSELLIIEPEYVEWDGTEELYPFVFESVGDWEITTSVSPPEGFVADHDSLSEEVNTEEEAVQFTITDVGSDWVSTDVEYKVKHKNKTEKIKTKIGVKLSKELAKAKGLDRFGKKKDKKDK